MLTIIFAALAAVALIAAGVLYYLWSKASRELGWAKEDILSGHGRQAMLEQEIRVLRESNRSANKAWQSERRRLFSQARDAEKHSSSVQEFHLANEAELKHQLAGAHALIELLFDKIPKDVEVKICKFEAQRVFRPVIEAFAPKIDKANPLHSPHIF